MMTVDEAVLADPEAPTSRSSELSFQQHPTDATADHRRVRWNSPAGGHAKVSVRFRSCLLSSALRCHWDGLIHTLLDLIAEALRGARRRLRKC